MSGTMSGRTISICDTYPTNYTFSPHLFFVTPQYVELTFARLGSQWTLLDEVIVQYFPHFPMSASCFSHCICAKGAVYASLFWTFVEFWHQSLQGLNSLQSQDCTSCKAFPPITALANAETVGYRLEKHSNQSFQPQWYHFCVRKT